MLPLNQMIEWLAAIQWKILTLIQIMGVRDDVLTRRQKEKIFLNQVIYYIYRYKRK